MSQRVVDKQVIYTGKRVRLEVRTLENEQTLVKHTREVVVHPGAVVVLPFLPNGQILLIRNRRLAIDEFLLELPAGTLERGEDPINCAGRELVEETGQLAGRLQSLGSFFTSPGVLSEKIYAYAAFDLQPVGTSPDEGEEIEPVPAPFEQVLEWIGDGTIHDGKTIATVLKYDRFYRTAAR